MFATASAIQTTAKISKIGNWTLVRVPKEASAQLPSRGQVMVEGSINNVRFKNALEPDGDGSHWLNIDKNLQAALKAKIGDSVTLKFQATKDWPEPTVPADVQKGIVDDPRGGPLWRSVTPMARWEWIRWIGSTANPDTRKKHVEVALSKLKKGDKRPCCFNRAMCTVPEVSKSGVLLPTS